MVLIYGRAVVMFVLMVSLFTPLAARGADVDDLKATYEQNVKALNARDLDGVMASAHDQVVAFGVNSPFPVDGKVAAQQAQQAVFANNESIAITPINPQFRVIGTTGVAWGHATVAFKPKGGPLTTTYVRFTFTYVKADGKWLRVAQHISRIPSGN